MRRCAYSTTCHSQNAQIALATRLQQQSSEFRKLQSAYMNRTVPPGRDECEMIASNRLESVRPDACCAHYQA